MQFRIELIVIVCDFNIKHRTDITLLYYYYAPCIIFIVPYMSREVWIEEPLTQTFYFLRFLHFCIYDKLWWRAFDTNCFWYRFKNRTFRFVYSLKLYFLRLSFVLTLWIFINIPYCYLVYIELNINWTTNILFYLLLRVFIFASWSQVPLLAIKKNVLSDSYAAPFEN